MVYPTPEGAAPMLVVWLPHVISFLFQALQIINFTWILHDGAVVCHISSKNFNTHANLLLRVRPAMDFGQNLNSKFAHSGSTVPFGTLRAPVVVFSMSVNLFGTTYKWRAAILSTSSPVTVATVDRSLKDP